MTPKRGDLRTEAQRQIDQAKHDANRARESTLKQMLRDQLTERGLPEPDAEEYRAIPKRMFRFDLAYVVHGLLIEIQGGIWLAGESGHSSGSGISRDVEKFALAASYGYRVLPLTPAMVEDGTAVELVARALGQEAA